MDDHSIPIPDYIGHNFNTLRRAVSNGDIALLSATNAKTGEPEFLVCAVQPDGDDGVEFVPLARMFTTNPYDSMVPPDGTEIGTQPFALPSQPEMPS